MTCQRWLTERSIKRATLSSHDDWLPRVSRSHKRRPRTDNLLGIVRTSYWISKYTIVTVKTRSHSISLAVTLALRRARDIMPLQGRRTHSHIVMDPINCGASSDRPSSHISLDSTPFETPQVHSQFSQMPRTEPIHSWPPSQRQSCRDASCRSDSHS